jgi:hypothetical protein
MKHTVRIIVIALAVLLVGSCTTTTGRTNNAPANIPIAETEARTVGTVSVEYTSHGLIGVTPRVSLLSWGDHSSYVALLDKAKEMGADDVVNIKTDVVRSQFWILYNQRTWVASGLAVKYE